MRRKHCERAKSKCQHRHEKQPRFGRLRRRLFWQIYLVVISSVAIVSVLAAAMFHFREQGGHFPLFPFLLLTALIVSLGAYPIAKRLTYRLEALKKGVEALGSGQLATRVPVEGCDEVAILAASFNQSAERIQALLASHRQLLANASHELRSPLARMQMSLAMLAEQKNLESSIQVQTLRQDMQELNQLVEEILLASRLDTLEIPVEQKTVDLSALLAEECARLNVDCEAEALEISGEERLLRRLIRNLLENAVRHGGGQVAARLVSQTEQVSLQVLDRGTGISAEAQAHIFEPFYRPAGHGESQGGWGLGLSLVKQIATRHGCAVTCNSRAGGGTIFEVLLPR